MVRAAWQDASVEAAHSAFRHGDDVFVVSGAAGKMLVRAQYAAADLPHAVGGMGASPAAAAYDVALSGLDGSDATAVPAAFAAVASGERVYYMSCLLFVFIMLQFWLKLKTEKLRNLYVVSVVLLGMMNMLMQAAEVVGKLSHQQ